MRLTFSIMSLAMFLTMFLPVWQHLNECIPFTIFADGSMYTFCLRLALSLRGIGAVLMHQHPLGHWKVIAYATRILNITESRYCVTQEEAL